MNVLRIRNKETYSLLDSLPKKDYNYIVTAEMELCVTNSTLEKYALQFNF